MSIAFLCNLRTSAWSISWGGELRLRDFEVMHIQAGPNLSPPVHLSPPVKQAQALQTKKKDNSYFLEKGEKRIHSVFSCLSYLASMLELIISLRSLSTCECIHSHMWGCIMWAECTVHVHWTWRQVSSLQWCQVCNGHVHVDSAMVSSLHGCADKVGIFLNLLAS